MGVPQRQQFPFFEEMHWFVAQKYVHRWRATRMVREAAEEAGQELVGVGTGTGVSITAFELAGLQPLAVSLTDWLDRQGEKHPDVPDAVKDDDGGARELLADLFAFIHGANFSLAFRSLFARFGGLFGHVSTLPYSRPGTRVPGT